MFQFNDTELEEFTEIANYLIELEWGTIDLGSKKYRGELSKLIGMGAGAKNSFFNYQIISSGSLNKLDRSFKRVVKKFGVSRDKQEIAKYETRLTALIKTVRSKDPIDPKSLKRSSAKKQNIISDSQKTSTLSEQGKKNNPKSVRNIIELFEGKKWFLYERVYRGIERHIMSFTKGVDSNTLSVAVKSMDQINSPWTGSAHFDESKSFLIIQTTKSRVHNSSPATYLIRVDNEAGNIDLCIGHVTLAKRSTKNIISKTVMLQRIFGKDRSIRLITWEAIAKKKRLVDPNIVRFFEDKAANRLTSPHSSIILNLKTLQEWHEQNDKIKREQRNSAIIGTYSIFYRGEMFKQGLTEDTLTIKENMSCDLTANYSHALDEDNIQESVGPVIYSPTTKSAFIHLTGPIGKSEIEKTNSIFLILNLPPGEKQFHVLTGIASGIRDTYDGCISLMVLAVQQKEKTTPIKKNDKKVVEFFKTFAHRALIIPPQIPVSSFKDLAASIPEGKATFQRLKEYMKRR